MTSRFYSNYMSSFSTKHKIGDVSIPFDASNVLISLNPSVEVYSRIKINHLINFDFNYIPYLYHGETKNHSQILEDQEIGIFFTGKNMFKDYQNRKSFILEILNNVSNCDAVNITNLIFDYISIESLASIYLQDTLEPYYWGLETVYKNNEGDEMIRYDYEVNGIYNLEQIKIQLDYFEMVEILSVFLVYSNYSNVIWRSDKPLNIDLEYVLKEKERLLKG
jgi:hypothetical protein